MGTEQVNRYAGQGNGGPPSAKPFIESRQKQSIPETIIEDLLAAIRGQFCGDLSTKEWCQQRRFFMRVILYPAAWLTRRGVTLPAERYKAVLLGILDEVKRHGKTSAVGYWPGYLLHCVQEHFRHHGDELYEEAKSARQIAGQMLSKIRVGTPPVDPIESLAAAASVLASHRRSRRVVQAPDQLGLL